MLLDQGLPATAAALLRNAGIEAAHTSEIGLAKATDQALIVFAVSSER